MSDSDQRAHMLSADGWERAPTGSYLAAIGPIWRRQRDGLLEFGLEARPEHANHRKIVHGGIIMAFAGFAVGNAAVEGAEPVTQEPLQIDVLFVSAVELGQFIVCRGEIVRRTSSVIFMRGIIEAGGNTMAQVQGVWKLIKTSNRTA